MNIKEERKKFEESFELTEAVILRFQGAEGYDVYNCSLPFWWEGKRYIFGRVERRNEWMRSWVRLFEERGKDEWSLVPGSMTYQLEDPYIGKIHNELILGGTHVKVRSGRLDTYYGYFYKGTDIHDMYYFTTGPDYMKDIRLVELADGKIGVFSRPRNEDIQKLYGSESMVGFAVIDSLKELTNDVIEKAPYVEGLFGPGEWGGCNQAYLLESGKVGAIGHLGYSNQMEGREISSYMNISFVLEPQTGKAEDFKIIGTRSCYPGGPAKMPNLIDCAFTSGIVMRPDGKADLYSGIGDCQEGRVVIPYPFKGFGSIVEKIS